MYWMAGVGHLSALYDFKCARISIIGLLNMGYFCLWVNWLLIFKCLNLVKCNSSSLSILVVNEFF